MRRFIMASTGVVMLAGATAAPSNAAADYHVRVPKGAYSASEQAFTAQHCPATFGTSPLQGVDAAVADVHAAAAARSVVNASWRGTVPANGYVQAKYYTNPCIGAPMPFVETSQRAGGWALHPPAGAYWVVFTTSAVADATITL
jgi:hypothetical protein